MGQVSSLLDRIATPDGALDAPDSDRTLAATGDGARSRGENFSTQACLPATAPDLRSSVMASRLLNSSVASSLDRRALLRRTRMTDGLSAPVLASRVPKSVSAEIRT